MYEHKTNWNKFKIPWCHIGPKLQLQIREDVKRIINDEPQVNREPKLVGEPNFWRAPKDVREPKW
jgi:hypothetical protein